MNGPMAKHIPLEQSALSGLSQKIHQCLFGLFMAQFALVWIGLWLPHPPFAGAGWPMGLLLVLATATLLASFTRHLPGQNVMLASAIIALIGSAATELGARTGIPFGPFAYTDKIGQRLFDNLPWAMPLIWIVFILSSRGVARLTLRPWRSVRNYGFWVIGLTAALTVWLDFGLEPFASRVIGYWRWRPTQLASDWYGAPWINCLGWLVITLLILAFATPSLIHKKPVKPPPPEYHPADCLAPAEFALCDRMHRSPTLAGGRFGSCWR